MKNDFKFYDETGSMMMYYNMDTNDFSTWRGIMIYNLWDYFWPSQIMMFLKKPKHKKKILSKQGKWVEIVCI